jgi:hypothetical protein
MMHSRVPAKQPQRTRNCILVSRPTLPRAGAHANIHAGDTCIDRPQDPIDVFSKLFSDFASGPLFWIVPWVLFQLRRLLINLGHVRPQLLRTVMAAPVHYVSQLLANAISGRMLVALEVAIEYWLSLTFSMDVRSVTEVNAGLRSAPSTPVPAAVDDDSVRAELRQEMEHEKDDVWHFILDRCAIAQTGCARGGGGE